MKPPAHLSATAKRLWNRLREDFAIDDAAGTMLLEGALVAFDRANEARQIIKREGCVLKDRFDQPKPHPACSIERDARSTMHAALRLLKLEPGELEG